MIDRVAFQEEIDGAREKLRHRLGARGKTLARALRRAGRSLPKPARQAGARLVMMQGMAENPRLRRLLDPSEVDAALAELNTHLDAVNVAERRKDRLLGFAGGVVFNLMLLGALIVALLRWRGIV